MRLSFPSLFPLLCLTLLFLSLALGLSQPNCETPDQGSTLQVLHVYSPCSPFRPKEPLSWEESVLQMQAKDKARLQFLSSLVARKSVVPIASGRQIVQNPTYIVRAKIGTPAQTMLMAMDTSSDVAWIPCNGCLGCSSTLFNSPASTTYKSLGCQAAQCKQVLHLLSPLLTSPSVVSFVFFLTCHQGLYIKKRLFNFYDLRVISGAKTHMRWGGVLIQPHLRWLLLSSQPLTGHHHPSHRCSPWLQLRLHTKGHRRIPTGAGPPGPGPRPLVVAVPDPKPIPIHILLLLA